MAYVSATANRNYTMYATRLGYRVDLNAGWEESNHDWDGFHQLPHLACHQRGGLRDPALRPQLLRDTWILVILLQGRRRLGRCFGSARLYLVIGPPIFTTKISGLSRRSSA